MNSCLGVVLAGGKSTRMGTDKAQLQLDNQTLLQRSQVLLKDCGISNVVVSGQSQISDIIVEQGPVGGIYSIYKQCQPQAMLIIPVDLPLLTPSVLTQLKSIGELSKKAVHFHQHSLPMYLPVSAFLDTFFAKPNLFVGTKGPSIRKMLEHIPNQVIDVSDAKALTNVNSPEQWRKIQSHYNDQRN